MNVSIRTKLGFPWRSDISTQDLNPLKWAELHDLCCLNPFWSPCSLLIPYLILRLELALLYNYFWSLWKLLVSYPGTNLSVSRSWALSSGMSYFFPWWNHLLEVLLEKSILLRLCPGPLEEHLLFFKGAVDSLLFKYHRTEISPGACRTPFRAGEATPAPAAVNLQHWDSRNESTWTPAPWQGCGSSLSGCKQPPCSVPWPV